MSSKLIIKDIKWLPKLQLDESIKLTSDWFAKFFKNKKEILKFTENQIKSFLNKKDYL